MKKCVLLLLLFVGVTNITFAQQDSISITPNEYVINSNVEKLVDKYSAKIEASITSLANTLKAPAEHVYKVLIKKTQIQGYASLILTIISCIFFLLGLLIGYKDDWRDGFWIALVIISGIGLITGITWLLRTGLQNIFNPEYGAMQEIINWIK